MTWNYRVVRKVYNDETILWGIHEVFYDDEGNPKAVTVDAIAPESESEEGIKTVLEWMLAALEKPILEYSDIGVASTDES